MLDLSLKSLHAVLDKHGVRLIEPPVSSIVYQVASSSALHFASESAIRAALPSPDMSDQTATTYAPFDEVWQMASNYNADFDAAAWDHLFSSLDGRPM